MLAVEGRSTEKPGHKEVKCWSKKKAQESSENVNYAFKAVESEIVDSVSEHSVDGWIVDSGASSHMTNTKNELFEFEEIKPIKVKIADGTAIKATGKGKVKFVTENNNEVEIRDVLYLEKLDRRLLSVTKLVSHGLVVEFTKEECNVYHKRKGILKAKHINGSYCLQLKQKMQVALTARQKRNWKLWHARMGHIPELTYKRAQSMVEGLPDVDFDDNGHVCSGCCLGKMKQENFPRNPVDKVKSSELLEIVHTDVQGPMSVQTPGGNRFAVLFTDDYSRYCDIFFMKKKSEVFEKFIEFKNRAESETGCKIKILRTDGGGEYVSKVMEQYLKDNGIRHQKSIPYTPQQNGLAERMNRTIMERARCMLYHAGVSKQWWAEAMHTAVWLTKRLPNSVNEVTPFKLWYGKKPVMKKLFVFGSVGYCLVPKEKRKKLDAKARPCMFLGYSDDYKGYRVCLIGGKSVFITRTLQLEEKIASVHPMEQLTVIDDVIDDSDGEEETMPKIERHREYAEVNLPMLDADCRRPRSDSTERMTTRSMSRTKRIKFGEEE